MTDAREIRLSGGLPEAVSGHWAFDLVGASHESVGKCWGLVRIVFARRHGLAIPLVAVGDDGNESDNAAAIRHAAGQSGWRRAPEPAQADDVVLMDGPLGRHVGVMVSVDGRLRLLHATRENGVVHQSLAEVACDGYTQFELWRRAA